MKNENSPVFFLPVSVKVYEEARYIDGIKKGRE